MNLKKIIFFVYPLSLFFSLHSFNQQLLDLRDERFDTIHDLVSVACESLTDLKELRKIDPLDFFVIMLKQYGLTVQQFVILILCELENRAFAAMEKEFRFSDDIIDRCKDHFSRMLKNDREQGPGTIIFDPQIPRDLCELIDQIYKKFNICGNLKVIVEPRSEDIIYFVDLEESQVVKDRILVINRAFLSPTTPVEEKYGALLHVLVGRRQFLEPEKILYFKNLIESDNAFYNAYGFMSILFADQFPASFSIEDARCMEQMLRECNIKNAKARYLEKCNQNLDDDVEIIFWDGARYPKKIPARKLRLKCVKTIRKLLEAEERVNNSTDPEIIKWRKRRSSFS